MKTKVKINIFFILMAITFAFSSCVKKNFDQPPSNCDDITIKGNISIADFKAMLGTADTLKITDSLILEGYMTSTDLYGNFYKELVIQDSTGGINFKINAGYIFETYPLGQKVFVKCKDLYLGKEYGVVKLGGMYLNQGILAFGRLDYENALKEHVIKSCDNNLVEPSLITLADLNDNLQYKLVKIENVQFKQTELNSTWADGINGITVNHNIVDSEGRILIVRTSGYASFAKDSLPKGSGSLIGVIGKYNTDYQLYVRSASDADMKNERFVEPTK